MIDDGDMQHAADDGALLRYDYFKFLTSLSIFSLGGVLALADRVPSEGRGKALLIAALAVVGLAGILAFTVVGEIVRSRTEGVPARASAIKWSGAAPMVLSVGLGMFVYLFVKSLG